MSKPNTSKFVPTCVSSGVRQHIKNYKNSIASFLLMLFILSCPSFKNSILKTWKTHSFLKSLYCNNILLTVLKKDALNIPRQKSFYCTMKLNRLGVCYTDSYIIIKITRQLFRVISPSSRAKYQVCVSLHYWIMIYKASRKTPIKIIWIAAEANSHTYTNFPRNENLRSESQSFSHEDITMSVTLITCLNTNTLTYDHNQFTKCLQIA